MKTLNHAKLTVLLLTAFSFGCVTREANPESATKTIVRAKARKVLLIHAGQSKSVSAGQSIVTNDIIETAADSWADVYIGPRGAQRCLIRIMPETKISFVRLSEMRDEISQAIDVRIRLEKGQLLGKGGKLAAASKFEILTPRGVLGIRDKGTIFGVSSDLKIGVIDGTIVCSTIETARLVCPSVINRGQELDPASFTVVPLSSPMVATLQSFSLSK
jgi:hypothetical protein